MQSAGKGTAALPEARQGRVSLCFDNVSASYTTDPMPQRAYASPEQAYAVARGQMAYHRALEKGGHVRVITDASSLQTHMAEWEKWDAEQNSSAQQAPPIGIVVALEGADPILEPSDLQEWWELGLRILTIAHHGVGRYAGGTGSELGLTELGAPLLAEMERLGVALDLTHLTDRGFHEALENFNGPVLASHITARALVPHQRQITDDQIRAIVARGGVIGATAACCWQLQPGWIIGADSNENVSLKDIVDHIDYVCQLAGNSLHAAVGTDLDGGFGRDRVPRDLETIADLQKLTGLLSDRGYEADDVAHIMYRNWVRFLNQCW